MLIKKVLLLSVISIAGCTSGANVKHTLRPPDTTYPIVIFHGQDGMQYGVWRRIRVDSSDFVDKDSTTRVKRWTRVPLYFIPINDSATKKVTYYRVREGFLIADMNVDTDSLAKVFDTSRVKK